MNILETRGVSKSYGDQTAIQNISLEVPKGLIYGLLGPNGAGKTTLIRIINQIIGPDEGELYFQGKPLRRRNISDIGYLPEERGLYKKMKVGEQLIYLARLKGLSRAEAYQEIGIWFEDFGISGWWDKKVEELSKGMAQKLQFIATVVHKPSLVILDEPFSGFDPVNAGLVKEKILELKAGGTTFMLSTHRMDSVEELCDRIALIHQSRKMLDGDVQQIKENYKSSVFEVVLNGYHDEQELKIPEGYPLAEIHRHPKYERTVLRFDVPEGRAVREMITYLLQYYEVHSMQEILPSINDIFISIVKDRKHA